MMGLIFTTPNGGCTVSQNLFQKVWQAHQVKETPEGQSLVFIGLHLIHEVTSPQAFGMLKDKNLKVAYPHRTFATVDHIIPTHSTQRPFEDPLAEEMLQALVQNTKEHGIKLYDKGTGSQGIVHVIGPELGLTQPGMTIVCGDSHTATHGAFGAIAFGIGTSQVRDVLACQTLKMEPLKVRRIDIDGKLKPGVTAKDVILHIIGHLGSQGGTGFAYEYGGSTVDAMTMDERMTLCNMSIEGGARCGYVNPDDTTFSFLKGKPYAPPASEWGDAVDRWRAFASDPDCSYDDRVAFDAAQIEPTLTYGVSPDQSIKIGDQIPNPESPELEDALKYMQLESGQAIKGTPINVAFIGSCTNGRLSDFEEVAQYIKGHSVADGIRAIAVPGSEKVAADAEARGIAQIFRDANFEWREPGCSMCLAMNPDKLHEDEICASSSNRNFKGRQGSPTGRTVLMSPLMVAASAISGKIADPREVFEI